MRSEITKDGTGDPEKPYFCDLRETHIRSVRLTVRGDIGKITDAFAALRSGSVEGLPPVVYASVNQATLEDILLSN
ncbi:hypothetical protein AGDE_12887 [Angomonas deanei]|nr:hypothetical protein AGDE_12887 [Angomonas deanei]|eukprot:EPY23336.1 hypothetical protein AGDE_12887 [Angomonas deanei]